MNRNSGFTLIEVLISMVILAIGLLGMAGLQVSGIRGNQSAYLRSQATQLAYDICDRMRANIVVAAPASGGSIYRTMDPDDANAQAACHTAVGCTPAQMAENDMFEWNRDFAAILPNGVGTITWAAPIYTVTMAWTDDNDGISSNDPSFQVSLQL